MGALNDVEQVGKARHLSASQWPPACEQSPALHAMA
jgi:hypothetical protein